MSTAVIEQVQEDVNCPSTPAMRPLKLRNKVLLAKDSLHLPDRANASASKAEPTSHQPRREKKTIMNFLKQK